MPKVFIAHRRSMDDEAVDALKAEVVKVADTEWKLTMASPELFEVTTARDDFKARFERCETMEDWVNSVAVIYDVVIVPERLMGHTTALIVSKALSFRKPVALWPDQMVKGLKQIDIHDFRNGWEAVT